MMEDKIISYELALKIKKLQFFEYCDNSYFKWREDEKITLGMSNYPEFHSGETLAPTQALLQKWLREKHNIHIYIVPWGDQCYDENNKGSWLFSGLRDLNLTSMEQHHRITEEQKKFQDIKFETYEDALEQGLNEALKLIKE